MTTEDLSLDGMLATLKARRNDLARRASRKETRANMVRMGGINVNGRIHFFNRIKSVTRDPGCRWRWIVETSIGTFKIEGGWHAGGSRSDWFLDGFGNKPIRGTSMMSLLRDIERA